MLLFILYFIFKLLTIFFWVCEFKVVIGCFRMLFLLYPRSEWNYLSFVNAENKFDEVVCWSGMAITWTSTFLFVMSVVIIRKCQESAWWNYVSIKNGYHVIFFMFFCYIFFLRVCAPVVLWLFRYTF